MLAEDITRQIGEAMKAKEEIRLSTLRLLSSALNYEFIAKQRKLSEEEELAVVRREAKKRKDAIEIYEKAGATERADKEKKELAILEEYLPAQMPESELVNLVDQVIKETNAKTMADMGKVIGIVVLKTAGRVDGGRVASLVKGKLA